MKANKGEWSELYVFFKILCDRRLPAADKNLEIMEDRFFEFHKIFRNDIRGEKTYDLRGDCIVILNETGVILKQFTRADIVDKTYKILDRIQSANTTTFEIPEAEELMEESLCSQLKAGNTEKADLKAVIFDRISSKEVVEGFSIKSMLGGASTLLNAGKTNNFVFNVSGLDESKIDEINSTNPTHGKIQKRLAKIVENGGTLTFEKVLSDTFQSNLKKIDTVFHLFIAQMLLDFFSGKASKITDLVDLLRKNELLTKQFQLSGSDYEFKIKNFLISSALGMVPSRIWDGFTKAGGGYIIVRESGIIVCYHLYNREDFLTYLFENTKFESASSTRHDYGKLYKKGDDVYFNLNLQIRFLK